MKVRLTREQKIKIANSEDVFAIMLAVLKRENRLGRRKEHFWVIGISPSHVIEFIELISLGTIDATIVKPLDVFHLAAAKNTPKIILVHNHPSGNLQASEEDIRLTQRLKEGARLLDIDIVDHLVISEEGYSSFLIQKWL